MDIKLYAQKHRLYNYDRYVASIFIPKEYRNIIAIINDFNYELSTIKLKATEPTIANIRYKWWADKVEDIFSNKNISKNNQHIFLLSEMYKKEEFQSKLHKDDILSIINARASEINLAEINYENNLLEYLSDTSYLPNKILLSLMGLDTHNYPLLHKACQKYITAWAITSLLRGSGYLYSKSKLPFSHDIITKFDINLDKYGSNSFIQNNIKLCEYLCQEAHKLITQGNEFLKKSLTSQEITKKKLKQAKFSLIFKKIATIRLKQIEKNHYDILNFNNKKFFGILDLFKLIIF